MVFWGSLLHLCVRDTRVQLHRQLDTVHHQGGGIYAQHKSCLLVGTRITLVGGVAELVAAVADHEVPIAVARIAHALWYDPLLVEHQDLARLTGTLPIGRIAGIGLGVIQRGCQGGSTIIIMSSPR